MSKESQKVSQFLDRYRRYIKAAKNNDFTVSAPKLEEWHIKPEMLGFVERQMARINNEEGR